MYQAVAKTQITVEQILQVCEMQQALIELMIPELNGQAAVDINQKLREIRDYIQSDRV